ncbi:collagen alpha-1(I) chain-like [Mustela nigripes]|uniref:collagen alpha-1(I) chain-like n=1 Tax=Mustela nigripes TaxID=77151 RepID=UPI0028157DD3|nr:collagen alpha-1(I) chain-like [Mustela nigripes]
MHKRSSPAGLPGQDCDWISRGRPAPPAPLLSCPGIPGANQSVAELPVVESRARDPPLFVAVANGRVQNIGGRPGDSGRGAAARPPRAPPAASPPGAWRWNSGRGGGGATCTGAWEPQPVLAHRLPEGLRAESRPPLQAEAAAAAPSRQPGRSRAGSARKRSSSRRSRFARPAAARGMEKAVPAGR